MQASPPDPHATSTKAEVTRAAALLALTVFVVGAGWAIVRLVAPDARAAYLRLGLGCAAMAAMLLPTATASAAAPLALLVAFAVILSFRLAGTFRGGETVAGRLAACCDVAMAAAMGFMLVAFL